MAFEKISNLKSYKKINNNLGVQSTQVKLEIENLKTILAAYTNANSTKCETDGEKTFVFAKSKTTVIYVDANNIVCSIEKENEFSFETNLPSQMAFFSFIEKETVLEKIDTNQFVATAKFEVFSVATTQSEFSAIKPGSENIFEKTKNIQLQNLTATCQDKFVVTDDSEITATSILSSDAKCVLTSTTATEDAIIADGELFVNILSEIDGNIKQTFKRITFSGEAVALGLKKDNIIDANAFVENLNATLSSAGANATLNITASIGISATCFAKSEICVVEDAFSENEQLIVSSQGIEINNISKSFYLCQSGGTILQTKDKNVNMGTILCVVAPKLENGILTCSVVYREAETDEIASIIMFANVDNCDECSDIAINSFAKKRAKEVMIEYELITKTTQQSENFEVFASEIEPNGCIEESNKGVIVYSAKKGDELFSVAKALNANPEILRAQNANIEDVFQSDKKVIYYKSEKMEL